MTPLHLMLHCESSDPAAACRQLICMLQVIEVSRPIMDAERLRLTNQMTAHCSRPVSTMLLNREKTRFDEHPGLLLQTNIM